MLISPSLAGQDPLQRSSERARIVTQQLFSALEKKKPAVCRLFVWRDAEGQAATAFLTPASAASASALSVFSQVNSGSSRPKWP